MIDGDQRLYDALRKTPFVEHVDPADRAPDQVEQIDGQGVVIALHKDQQERHQDQKGCQQVGWLHTVFVQENGEASFDDVFQAVGEICAGQVTFAGDVVHLFPVFHGHVVADMRSAAAPVIVCFLCDAKVSQRIGTFFIFGPGIEVPHPLSVMIDPAKVGPFLPGVGDGIQPVQNPHAGQQYGGKNEKFGWNFLTAGPVCDQPFGKPQHTGNGQHQIEDILTHTEGDPCKKQGRQIPFEEGGHRPGAFGRREAKQRRSGGKARDGSILRFGNDIQIYDEKENADGGQGRLPERILAVMALPQVHAADIDGVKAGDLYAVHKQAVPRDKAAQRIQTGQKPG